MHDELMKGGGALGLLIPVTLLQKVTYEHRHSPAVIRGKRFSKPYDFKEEINHEFEGKQ